MKELTHTITGTDAAAAKILEEVQAIFWSKSHRAEPKDDWRLEFYIIQVMSADFASAWEWRRSKIIDVVTLACGYDRPKKEWDTAFRRLTRRKFLYGSYTQAWGRNEVKERSYGLALSRYDTEEVAA